MINAAIMSASQISSVTEPIIDRKRRQHRPRLRTVEAVGMQWLYLEIFQRTLLSSLIIPVKEVAHVQMMISRDGTEMELCDIHLAEKYQRLGIGTQLLQRVDQLACQKKCRIITGHVTQEDFQNFPGLLDWYRQNGFTIERVNPAIGDDLGQPMSHVARQHPNTKVKIARLTKTLDISTTSK